MKKTLLRSCKIREKLEREELILDRLYVGMMKLMKDCN